MDKLKKALPYAINTIFKAVLRIFWHKKICNFSGNML